MTLLKGLRVRLSQGSQYVPDPLKARLTDYRGRATLDGSKPCPTDCRACVEVCPTNAITTPPLSLDLGACVYCNECVTTCPAGKIAFTPEFRMAGARREDLVVREGTPALTPVAVSREISRRFGRSLKLRSVSSGGCNGCELELNALGNVNFDLGRYGIEFVASPRHADALVLSGPLTRNMSEALELAWSAMPEPRFVIVTGTCAISGGFYHEATGVDREFLDPFPPALYVPGCPPHPLTFIAGIMELLGRA
jgi:Ni,Fe-hydrogenase III small subunit/NAD-dependent dihydropyrimidine dehydrogenase PreA subunit